MSMSGGGQLSRPVAEPPDHGRGAAAPSVTLVIYGDYECPYTTAAYRSVQGVEQVLGDDLRFVFRHFPLTHKHPHAEGAAEAAEAAAVQGRFWEMHDRLFQSRRALRADDLRRHAVDAGLDLDRFEADLAGDAPRDRVALDVESGRESGVGGTPTIFIDGQLYEGRYDRDTLLDVLAAAAAGQGRTTRGRAG